MKKHPKKAEMSTAMIVGIIILLVLAIVMISWGKDVIFSGKKGTNDLFYCEAKGNYVSEDQSSGVCVKPNDPCPDGMEEKPGQGRCSEYYKEKIKCCACCEG